MLTHGLMNDMICAKDVVYKADKIWKPFTADNCTTLAGKPKLFFFQVHKETKTSELKFETNFSDNFWYFRPAAELKWIRALTFNEVWHGERKRTRSATRTRFQLMPIFSYLIVLFQVSRYYCLIVLRSVS